MKKFLLVTVLTNLLLSGIAFASISGKKTHLFGGVGNQFVFSSIRAGGSSWELGLIADRLPGILAIADLSERLYAVYGIMMTPVDVGLYAGVGADFLVFLNTANVRFEGGAVASPKNYTSGHLTLGINIGY